MDREVTLSEVLAAREARATRQRELLKLHGQPVISFCMNIAGPVKNGPAIRRGFQEGMLRLTEALRGARLEIVCSERIDAITGCEALLAVRGDAWAIKRLCVDLEDEDDLGRLFDLDVLAPGGAKLDREQLDMPPRPCLICGQAGKGCASRRVHSVAELQARTGRILRDYFARADGDRAAGQAMRALLYEVCATPKPGLVDRANSGSHRDMDIFTFVDSASALLPYLREAFAIGCQTAECPPEETFRRLRRAGLRAERAMFRATGGVNTHKGAIFSLGTACAASGRLWTPEVPCASIDDILGECARMASDAVAGDLAAIRAGEAETSGQKLYITRGLRGIRGELADGLPSVARIALPALREALARGDTLERAGVCALLSLIAGVEDTNLYARGGEEGQHWASEQAAQLAERDFDCAAAADLDAAFIQRNLSPGGCADLLAITYFLYFYTEERRNDAE